MSTTLVSVEEYLGTSYPDGDREYVDGRVTERSMGEIDHGHLQTRLAVYLVTHYPQYWTATEVRMRVSQTRFRVPDLVVVAGPKPQGRVVTEPPLLVIEILSPDDRAADLEDKLSDYFAFGVEYVWVVNPRSRQGRVHTSAGSREVRGGSLRTERPVIDVPLAGLFD